MKPTRPSAIPRNAKNMTNSEVVGIHSDEWDEPSHRQETDEPRVEHKLDSGDSRIYFRSLAEEWDPEEILKDSNSIYETSLVLTTEMALPVQEEKKHQNQLKNQKKYSM